MLISCFRISSFGKHDGLRVDPEKDIYRRFRQSGLDELMVIRDPSDLVIYTVATDLEESRNFLTQIFGKDLPEPMQQGEAFRFFLETILGKYDETASQNDLLVRIKEGYSHAIGYNAAGPVLSRFYRQGMDFLQGFGNRPEMIGTCSNPAEAAIDIARKISENISGFQILLVGNDRAQFETLVQLLKHEIRGKIYLLTNHRKDRYELSLDLGCIPLEQELLEMTLTGNTIIMSSEELTGSLWKRIGTLVRSHRDQIYIYFQFTTAPVENGLQRLPNFFIQNLDQIHELVALHIRKRKQFIDSLDDEIREEMENFYDWLHSDQRFIFSGIVSRNRTMQQIFETVHQVAPADISVLISGETGTGKELIARAIHTHSNRSSQNFVAVNCSAIPETLLEAELFGYEKGAFTGAVAMKKGLVEMASGGTLFLDEIGDIPPLIQIKLLRVLQEREIMRIGNPNPLRVDVRLIAATNRDIDELITGGSFRTDFFYRINTVQISLPPLTERKEDIPLLCRYFIDKHSRRQGKNVHAIAEDAKDRLQAYHWPGNVRELENVIERAVAVSVGDRILLSDLPRDLQTGRKPPIAKEITSLRDLEANHIAGLLERESHNYSKVADLLGISRTTLWRKMKEYNLAR
jgi:DNA-binding NtrC family response regulator